MSTPGSGCPKSLRKASKRISPTCHCFESEDEGGHEEGPGGEEAGGEGEGDADDVVVCGY